LRESNLPPGVRGKHCENIVKAIDVVQFGKCVRILVAENGGQESNNEVGK
jgi:hypothetical protein